MCQELFISYFPYSSQQPSEEGTMILILQINPGIVRLITVPKVATTE